MIGKTDTALGQGVEAATRACGAGVARHGLECEQPAAERSPDPELAGLFQIGSPPVDVAILVDASLRMRSRRYADVRQAVIDFTSTFAGAVRVFGDVASATLEGPADKIAGNVATYLPAEPMFQNTDLGVAIQKGLEFFERDGAGEAHALFLLTDGRHHPPPNSPYTRDFANDPDWQALRRRAHALCLKGPVFVYGFGLGTQTDVSLLLEIFPAGSVEVVVGAAEQVATALRRTREKLEDRATAAGRGAGFEHRRNRSQSSAKRG